MNGGRALAGKRCALVLACVCCFTAGAVHCAESAGSTPGVAAAGARQLSMESFAGLWEPIDKTTRLLTLAGSEPPLNAKAQRLYQAYQAAAAKGDRWFDTEEDCLPLGITRLMAESPFEMIVDRQRVALMFQWNRFFVHFAPRRSQHPKQYDYPNYNGHSIAYLRGDKLILDSTYFTSDTVLDASGLPHSGRLHVVQSLALEDKDTLVDTLTITDPGAFTSSWNAQLRMKRMPAGARLQEDDCVVRKNLAYMHAHRRREAGLAALGLTDLE